MSNGDNEVNVYLRSGSSGSYKTCDKINELKKTNGRKIILGPTHAVLSEQEKWIPNSKHWWGLASKNGCPCLRETGYPEIPREKRQLIKKIVDLEFTYDHVCSNCKDIRAFPQKKCPYRKQFHNIQSSPFVLAPITYAFSNRIKEYDPQEIVVDDCILSLKEHSTKGYLQSQLTRLMNLTDKHSFLDSKLTLEQLNKNPDYNNIIEQLNWAYKENIDNLLEQAKKKDWDINRSTYDKKFLISPNDIDTYCKLARVYGYQKQFATLAIFRLLDYIVQQKAEGKNVKLTVIDAKPRIKFYNNLSERYFKEKGVIVNFVSDGFKPKLVDQGSLVYEIMARDAIYCKETLENLSTKKSLKEMTEWVLVNRHNNDPNLKIGVIMNKPEYIKNLISDMRLYVPERFNNVKVETRYSIRGKNSLENCDVLFIYGTAIISKYEIKRQFLLWHGHPPSTLETFPKEKSDYWHYKDEALETFRQLREEDETYHEIHRIRPWLSKKWVYVFGKVPKSVEEEGIKVEKLSKKTIIDFERNKWLEEFVKEKSPVPRIVAEKEMVEQFGISEDWASREVLKIVNKNKHLSKEKGALFYEK